MQETTKILNTITIGSAMKYIVAITGILINYGIEFKKDSIPFFTIFE